MLDILKKLNKILNKQQKLKAMIIVMMMVVVAILETLGVSMVIPIITLVIQPDIIKNSPAVRSLCESLHLTQINQIIVVFLLCMIAIYLMKGIITFLQYYIQYRFIYNNRLAFQSRLFKMTLDRPYQDFLLMDSAKTRQMLSGDVNNVFLVLSTIMLAASELLVVLFLGITIFLINPEMTALAVIVLVTVSYLMGKVIRPRLLRWGKAVQQENIATSRWILRALEGIKEIKIGEKEFFFYNQFTESGGRYASMEKRYNVFSNVPRLITETVFFIGILLALLWLILSGNDIKSLISQLSAMAVAAVRLMPAVNRINNNVNQIIYLKPSVDVVFAALEKEEFKARDKSNEEIKATEKNSIQLSELKSGIELRNIEYCYPNSNTYVLKNANMVIPAGKSIGIIGTSGAGKTTLVDILLGLLQKNAGQIIIDGSNVEVSTQYWNSAIGYIPQSIFLMDDTVKANVAFGLRDKDIDEAQVWRALEEAQIAEHVRKMPEGIYTSIGERGIRLSGGQRQRLGIARALYKNPPILVLDEATSALDNETEASIMEAIEHFQGKKTIIIIAHRLTTIRNCDIIYRVEDGMITEADMPQ